MVTTRSRAKKGQEPQAEAEVGAPPAPKPRARKKEEKEVQEPEEGQQKITDFMEGGGQAAEEGEGTQEGEEEPAPKKARTEGSKEEAPAAEQEAAPVEPAPGAEEAPTTEEAPAPEPAEAMGGEAEEAAEEEAAEETFPYPQTQPATQSAQQEGEVAQEGGEEEGAASPRKGAPATEGAATPAAPAPAPTQQRDEAAVEAGRVQFLYRPRVGVEEAAGLADVQRFFMVLAPEGAGRKARLAVIGKKRLPAVAKHERFFGFIEAVSEDVGELLEGLGERSYETKTRGTRHLAAARALGEGSYSVLKHKGGTNFVFRLEVPAEPGEVQSEFELGKEGSYVFTIKNPYTAGGQALGLEQKADYSEEQKAEFAGGHAWIPVHDPSLLDYKHCEFLLVAAAHDLHAELGEAGAAAAERAGSDAAAKCGPESDEECLLGRLKEDLEVERTGIDTQPAETGEFK